ncbi:UNVERIFIED_CONTAM: hypothetical protein GTU68_024029 [Idotea baltica]|nr:hypothetical protein [Idotea baltica]
MAEIARDVDRVTVVDLYAEYPTFAIDVDREQGRLLDHDVIIFQHPVYWYSSPAILKEWQDLVLEHGFAYGSEGRALEGKSLLSVVTAGAREDVYAPGGSYELTLRQFFAPFEHSALLCRMRYLAPFALFAAGHADEEGRLDDHLARYRRLLESLTQDQLDLDEASKVKCLRTNLDGLLKPQEPSV